MVKQIVPALHKLHCPEVFHNQIALFGRISNADFFPDQLPLLSEPP
jgi:hypothetical protein